MTEHDDLMIGTRVFLRCTDERMAGTITGVLHEPTGTQYRVMFGNRTQTWHYVMELSTEYVPNFKDAK